MAVTWFPCTLQPASFLDFHLWDVTRGLRVVSISDDEKAILRSFPGRDLFHEIESNFLVKVDEDEFAKGLFERLSVEGHDIEKLIENIPSEFNSLLKNSEHIRS